MRLLLDSHMLVWWVGGSTRLSPRMHELILDATNEIWLSVATAWELSIKAASGRLDFPATEFDEMLDRFGIRVLDIRLAHAMAAAALPRHHDDPFDRMLIAQARAERMVLATADAKIARYMVETIS